MATKEWCLLNGLYVRKNEVYECDVATLKQYREDYYRITLHRQIRRTGYEAVDGEPERGRKNTAGNERKLSESLSRTRAAIFELALCNPWEWFVTLTLNPEYHDRKDLKTYKKKLSVFLKNYNRLHHTTIKYLLIPELHHDKIHWHMHGLMMGLPEERLKAFSEKEKLPIQILIELKKGNQIYRWPAYEKAFGYITISKIRSAEGVSKYITKYITKDLNETRIDLNDHLYYCSHGLQRAKKLYQGPLTKEIEEDYSNEYVKIKTVRTLEEALTYFIDAEESVKLTVRAPQ